MTNSNKLCAQCLNFPPPFERLTALFNYAWPVSGFIAHLKYAGKLHFAKMLGSLMAKHLSCQYPIDCVIAMPLHPKKQRQRGFNQTIEIAKWIAKMQKRPLNNWHCTKITDTQAQAKLSAADRGKNLSAKAFYISPNFVAKHVLVIEDVVTTGATIHAFATALKNHGVSTVEVWCVCRTSLV
ncbi:MAG: ComF family protein [Proteobacteria bacterium]|nr:ComF family protein [Pseudomonadota bacterium]